MDKKLTAKIELLEQLTDNEGFLNMFKAYLWQTFVASRDMNENEVYRLVYDFEHSSFSGQTVDSDCAQNDDAIHIIDISQDTWNALYVAFVENSTKEIIERLQEEVKCEKDSKA